jgi:hypothetical protein
LGRGHWNDIRSQGGEYKAHAKAQEKRHYLPADHHLLAKCKLGEERRSCWAKWKPSHLSLPVIGY